MCNFVVEFCIIKTIFIQSQKSNVKPCIWWDYKIEKNTKILVKILFYLVKFLLFFQYKTTARNVLVPIIIWIIRPKQILLYTRLFQSSKVSYFFLNQQLPHLSSLWFFFSFRKLFKTKKSANMKKMKKYLEHI